MLKTQKQNFAQQVHVFIHKTSIIVTTKRFLVMEILLNEFTWQGQVMPIIKRFVKEYNKQQ